MHSACMCILSVVLFISDTLLVIVSSTLFLRCGGYLSRRQLFSYGNSEVMHSACVCILSIVLFISDTLLVIVSSTSFLLCCGGVCLVDNYSAMETVR